VKKKREEVPHGLGNGIKLGLDLGYPLLSFPKW